MDKRFFHFPLCLLSFGRDVTDRLNGIISLGCVELGIKQWQKFSPAQQHFRRSYPPHPTLCNCRIDLSKDEELQVVAGCEYLNVVCLNVKGILADYARVTRFIKDFERKHGTDARVRVRKDWVFEVRDNKDMSYPEFAVLAAIYSIIGDSEKPVRITREYIWKRAHGFKSDLVFRTEMDGRPPFLTERQVRSIIERLHDRKFFARRTYGRRQTYYSNRMSPTSLEEQVFRAKIQRSLATQARRRAAAALTKRIQEERRRLAGPTATEAATDAPL
jgi:predicted transcriptional regulator